MGTPDDPLEDLLFHALVEHNNAERSKRSINRKKDLDANYRASFRPDNWKLVGQTQLVHLEDNVRTLVGLFDEMHHISVPRCRRLVAAKVRHPGIPFKVEEVYGEHWLSPTAWQIRHQEPNRTLEVIADLTLDLGQDLTASAVICEARLVGGGLQRLCIKQDTIFEGTSPRTIVCLPEGLDILEGLTNQTKVAVWAYIKGV